MSEAAIFEDLIQHERWLTRLARRLVRGDDVSELVQETFVRAIAAPPADLTRPRAWLETVLRNLATSLHRRNAPENLDALEAAEALSTHATRPELAIERFEAARVVSDAVRALPRREKQVVLMYWQEGSGVGEISRSLGLTDSAIRKQLASAHERLRHKLRDDYGDERWAAILGPLLAPRTPQTAVSATSTASVALVSTLAVAGACALVIWFTAPSADGGVRPALSWAGTATLEADDNALGTPDRTTSVMPASAAARVPQRMAAPDEGAAPPLPSAAQAAALPLAIVRGGLVLDGEPITGWAARLRQLEGCVENCTVHATMADTSFELGSAASGHHRLVLDSDAGDDVHSTLRSEFPLAAGQQLELRFEQATTGLLVTGVPERYSELFAYWTDGAGLEFMQRVLVQNGTAEFPAAPVGPVEIKVRHERIYDPGAWDVLGQVRLSSGETSTLAL